MQGLADIVRRNAGEPMQPLVQTRSNRNGETTLIYARPLGGDRVALLIFAHDREDTTRGAGGGVDGQIQRGDESPASRRGGPAGNRASACVSGCQLSVDRVACRRVEWLQCREWPRSTGNRRCPGNAGVSPAG